MCVQPVQVASTVREWAYSAMRVVGEARPSLGLLLLSLTERCTSLAQDGAPVMGVRPVWPSIIASRPKLNTAQPLEGVVMGMPIDSATVVGGALVVTVVVLRGKDVGRENGWVVSTLTEF